MHQMLPAAAWVIMLFALKTLHEHNKKHLKNVGPIRHCEPPHAHSPGVTASRLRIDIYDDNDNDNHNA